MTDDVTAAIQRRFEQQHEARRAARYQFTPDPDLEVAGERLDQLKESHPEQYRDLNFGGLKDRVDTYRRRKADHEKEQQR